MAKQDDNDQSQKTEDPTPRRLEEAHKEGNIPLSREVVNWCVLMSAGLLILYYLPSAGSALSLYMAQFFAKTDQLHLTSQSVTLIASQSLKHLTLWLLPCLGILLIAGVLGTGLQTQFKISLKSLEVKLSKISLLNGFKRLFSFKSVLELVKGLLKITIVGGLFTLLIYPLLKSADLQLYFDEKSILSHLHELSGRLFMVLIAFLTVIAILDYLLQRREYMKQLRMSRHEVKQELRESEGDPHIKARVKQLRTERARHRMMSAVPRATVVITNPTHYAIALEYVQETMDAPKVIAKGMDLVALKIREIATAHRVPLVSNPPLAQALHKTLDIDDEILPEHYKAVAEIIRYVMTLKEQNATLY